MSPRSSLDELPDYGGRFTSADRRIVKKLIDGHVLTAPEEERRRFGAGLQSRFDDFLRGYDAEVRLYDDARTAQVVRDMLQEIAGIVSRHTQALEKQNEIELARLKMEEERQNAVNQGLWGEKGFLTVQGLPYAVLSMLGGALTTYLAMSGGTP